MKFGEILKSKEAEGKEKHVPIIEIDKEARKGVEIVRVIVGKEVPHPNTVEHHIDWIELYGVKKGGQLKPIIQHLLAGRMPTSHPNLL